MLNRLPASRLATTSPIEWSSEPLARTRRPEGRIELRRLSDSTTSRQPLARVVLPLEQGNSSAPAATSAAAAAIESSAIAAMLAKLADPSQVTDPALASAARQALSTLSTVYGGEASGRVYEAIAHWMGVAGGLMRPATTTGASTSTSSSSSAATSTSSARTGRGSNDLAASSVPYAQLPERMKGGTSSGNGMPIIIVRDASELASLPMWGEGMHPAAAQSYYDRLAEALRNESGSVMGFAGYEIEVVGTNGVERGSQANEAPKPYVSNADIAAFVNANLSSPGKIASAMREYGVSFDRIEEATGYSRKQIVDYVMASSCQELIALL